MSRPRRVRPSSARWGGPLICLSVCLSVCLSLALVPLSVICAYKPIRRCLPSELRDMFEEQGLTEESDLGNPLFNPGELGRLTKTASHPSPPASAASLRIPSVSVSNSLALFVSF